MKANFVIPSWSYWKEPIRAQPLTQFYLATLLEDKGVEVDFTDLRNGPKKIEEADYYMYTIASPDLKEVRNIRRMIKAIFPKSKHIAGGPHPTIYPQDLTEFNEVVQGRGEPFIDKLTNTTTIKYTFPRRHFLSEEKIVGENLFKTDNIKSTTAQFSFGCQYTCSFCANYQTGPIRRNSIEDISDEIDYLKENYGIQGLSLQDEVVIPHNKKEANDFLNLLKSKEIYWRGQTRALKDTSILRQAKESGLVELSFGLESVNQSVVDLANKKIRVSDVENTIQACKDYGIKTRIYLLNGLPGEPESIVNETIKFIEKNNPDLVLLSSLQPYPGSPIAENPEKYGIKWISHDYEKFNHLVCRFKDSTDNPENAVPYEFEDGKGMSRLHIMSNMLHLQEYLRGRDMNK